MNTGHFYFDNGNARKFWTYQLRGKKQTIRYGRIGSDGRQTEKTFGSPSAALTDTEKLKQEKLRKGYVQVDPSKLSVIRPKGKRKASETQIAKLEAQLGVDLPQEYRSFLLTQNGGVPDPFFVTIPGHPSIANVAVGFILGLYGKCEPYQSLAYAIEHKMPRLPKGHLPIAGDSDIFSISIMKKPGCVYFWNHETPDFEDEDEDDEGYVNYKMSQGHLLAGSFDEFLTRIAMFKEGE